MTTTDEQRGPYLDPLERARRNPRSKTEAIRAKCFDCVGGDADPCWRWCVGNCGCPDCPLHPVRPYRHLHGKPMPASLIN